MSIIYPIAVSADGTNNNPPQNVGVSWLSTFGYLVTLLFVFFLIIGLAYITSRFLGNKMIKAVGSNARTLAVLPLGPERSVNLIEIAGKYLIIGVTGHNINLLQEVTKIEEISKIREQQSIEEDNRFEAILAKQLHSLQQMSQKFPAVFPKKRNYD